MKQIFLLLLLIAANFSCQDAQAQKSKKVSHENNDDRYTMKEILKEHNEYVASSLYLYNLNGDVNIEKYEGTKIVVDIDITLKANTSENMSLAKREVKPMAEQKDHLELYQAEPYDTRPNSQKKNNNNKKDYSFDLTYNIKMPASSKLNLNTINGDMVVENIAGDININSVNGDIKLLNVGKVENAKSVNGDINVTSNYNQTFEAKYNTVNGDVNVTIPSTYSGECHFKSLNGEFYTDFEKYETIGSTTQSSSIKKNKKYYKIDKIEGIKIGDGSSKINIETLNGDVHLRKS
jgi:DUF4097 and DUF4098 domain-containing protein YvlB